MLPVARVNELHLEQVGDDLVVFDQRTHAAHSLNAAAAFIWEHCDGEHSVAQIVDDALRQDLELPAESVEQTLDLLRAKLLLTDAAEPGSPVRARLTRRMLAKTAVAALVPAIVSIAAPASALVLSGSDGDG